MVDRKPPGGESAAGRGAVSHPEAKDG